MNVTLSIRFLVRLVILFGIIGVSIHLIHRRQASKQAQAFLHQADEAQKKGDLERAISYLSRYLVFERSDSNARARMGFAMARLAKRTDEKEEAFLVLEQVLRDDPERHDVRKKNVRLAMDPALRHYDEALDHLKKLTVKMPDDAELLDLMGQCLAAQGEYAAADVKYAEAIQLKPDSLKTYARRAGLLRLKLKDIIEDAEIKADEVIANLVENNNKTAHAHLIAAAYWNEFGTEAKAKVAMDAALKYGEHDGEVLLRAAEFALNRAERARQRFKADESKDEIQNARKHLQLGIEKNPAPVVDATASEDEQDSVALKRAVLGELYRNLVLLEVRTGQLPEAETLARKGVEVIPEQVELVLSLADVLIRRDKTDEAAENLKKLQEAGYPQAILDYHHARIQTRKNQWLPASHKLVGIIPDLLVFPAFARQANFLLGECYDRMGEIDLRHDAFKNARPNDIFDPLWVPASVALAASQAELGLIKEAITTYRSVARFAPGAVVPLARLLIMETLRQPPDKQDWKEVDEVLKLAPESLDATLLRSDVFMARGLMAEAKKTLEAAKEKYADQVELWVGLALHAFIQKDAAGAEKILNEAESKFGDRVEIRLTRARFLPAPATPESTKRLAELASGIDKLSAADRRRLLTGIAEIARSLGAKDLASGLWEQLAVEVPDNLAVQYKRFDRAIQSDDEPGMLKVMGDIRRIDGSEGTGSRMARAMYLIWKARKGGDNSGLAEAELHLTEVAKKRPGWGRIRLGLAVVYDLKGDAISLGKAIEHYQQAVDAGERDPEVVRRLIHLYYSRNRFPEAELLLRNAADSVANKEGFQFMAAEISLGANKFVEALELAEKAITQDTKDYQKHLWLGRVRWLCGKKVEAESPFRKAVELAGDQPEPWIALIQYLNSIERKPDAEKLLKEAALRVKKEDASLTLAQGFEILGSTKEAQQWFEKALAERPEHLPTLRGAVNFRLRQARTDEEFDSVRALLEQIIKLSPNSSEDKEFARSVIAITLSMSPDYRKSRRALEMLGLLDESPLNPNATVEEMRTRAIVLSLQRGLKPRIQAAGLLESIDVQRRLSADDRFLLSQLYYLVGEREKAKGQLAALVRNQPNNTLYLSSYIRFLILEGDPGSLAEAQKYLTDLEKAQPDALVTAELRARMLFANPNKKKDAVTFLVDYVKKKKDMALSAARLLEGFKEFGAAEVMYRQVIEDTKKPIARLVLAEFYARQNRNADALKLLEQNPAEYPPASLAMASLGVLYTVDQPRAEDIRRVRTLLQQNAPKGSDQLMEEAALCNLEGDYSKAVKIYEQIIARDPKNVLAINNYAFLLAFHQKKTVEAIDWIRKAKAQSKPEPVLFDTEAIILIQAGNAAAAVELLQDAVVDAPTASSYFHLAQAYLQTGKRPDATAALVKARKAGLRPSDLHPLEKEAYQNVLGELD